MIKKLLFPFALFFFQFVFSQKYDPLHPPNSYRSPSNPHYWKNRKPFPGYWQQDVHYKIKANIDEKTDIITGNENIIYWNNSPNTLYFVFFHLYQNAFQPGSYYDMLHKANKRKPKYGKYESQGKGTEILSLTVNGKKVKTELDNTILKVYLPKPLLPNSKVNFEISFKTYFDKGSVRRRMKTFDSWGYKHYDGVHWYPRISVYDRKFGWTTDQHLGREFYGDFGTYDVELTFANNFIVGATGFLLNRNEVLPPDLRKKLDIKNFKNKKWNEMPSEIIPYDSTKRKTWIYHAENVHDFAFTADPTYRIGEAEWDGIKCYALAREPHAALWQNAAEYTAKIIKTYSTDFGRYIYHKMIVADADDGMEYPMLTLDGGFDPQYRGLLAHEVGHNWFFGMIGNNETYRALLDEGFTQFLTTWAAKKLENDTVRTIPPKNKYVRYFRKAQSSTYTRAYYGYIRDAMIEEDAVITTHSDDFNGALRHGGGYRHVYMKTATMLYNLQYVLGDNLFLKAMKHYFKQWYLCHPYVDDFRNSIIQFTKVDLNWFFDQWLNTKKNIDYAIKSIKNKGNGVYDITFKRKGEMQMPLEFTVYDKNDSAYNFYIPNTWFEKQSSSKKLDRWIGWGKLNKTYTTTVELNTQLKDVVIDTSYRLADINLLNNSKKLPLEFNFDSKIYNIPDWKHYEIFVAPNLWLNNYDGLKVGININGNYMNKFHIFNFNFWVNTGFGQGYIKTVESKISNPVSYTFSYKTSTHKIIKRSQFFLSSKYLDGLTAYKIGFEFRDRSKKNKFYSFFKSMIRKTQEDLEYLLYPSLWEVNKLNNTFNIGLEHNYFYPQGKGDIDLRLRSSSLLSDYNYAQLSLSAINKNKVGFLDINTRFYAMYGTGTNTAKESALYLSGANPEELMESKYTRSLSVVPYEWVGDFSENTKHFQIGGGLNIRGYAGYLAPEEFLADSLRHTFKGNTGASFNLEIGFDRIIKFKPKSLSRYFSINSYLFGDAGIINMNTPNEDLKFGFIRADAGLGFAFTIKKWWFLETAKPLTLRFDMPFFLNTIPSNEKNYINFRWIVGINRAF